MRRAGSENDMYRDGEDPRDGIELSNDLLAELEDPIVDTYAVRESEQTSDL